MKKLLALLSVLIIASQSLVAFADPGPRSGRLTLRDGRSIVRIEVGDERDDREMLRRIHRLESAVRDLQDQVYQLQTAPRTITRHVCSADFFTVGIVVGRGNTMIEAKAEAIRQCQVRGGNIFCKERELRCETVEELY